MAACQDQIHDQIEQTINNNLAEFMQNYCNNVEAFLHSKELLFELNIKFSNICPDTAILFVLFCRDELKKLDRTIPVDEFVGVKRKNEEKKQQKFYISQRSILVLLRQHKKLLKEKELSISPPNKADFDEKLKKTLHWVLRFHAWNFTQQNKPTLATIFMVDDHVGTVVHEIYKKVIKILDDFVESVAGITLRRATEISNANMRDKKSAKNMNEQAVALNNNNNVTNNQFAPTHVISNFQSLELEKAYLQRELMLRNSHIMCLQQRIETLELYIVQHHLPLPLYNFQAQADNYSSFSDSVQTSSHASDSVFSPDVDMYNNNNN